MVTTYFTTSMAATYTHTHICTQKGGSVPLLKITLTVLPVQENVLRPRSPP